MDRRQTLNVAVGAVLAGFCRAVTQGETELIQTGAANG